MRRVLLVFLVLSGAAMADDGDCPPKTGDPCLREQREVCSLDNPPPWSTPESQAKRREKAEKDLAACRKRHEKDEPPKKRNPLPPWRKP